jgi:hypothetical protein
VCCRGQVRLVKQSAGTTARTDDERRARHREISQLRQEVAAFLADALRVAGETRGDAQRVQRAHDEEVADMRKVHNGELADVQRVYDEDLEQMQRGP